MTENNPQSAAESTAAEHLKDQIREAVHDTKEKTADAAREVKDRCSDAAIDAKEGLAHRVSRLGGALRGAADELRRDGDSNIAAGVAAAARRAQEVADYLHRSDFRTFRDESAEFTRRHPEWVCGGLFMAGLAIARLVKASPRSRWSEPEPGDDFEAERSPEANASFRRGPQEPAVRQAPMPQSWTGAPVQAPAAEPIQKPATFEPPTGPGAATSNA